MNSNRTDRIGEEIRHALSDLLRTLKDPRIHGLVSITRCDVSGDLSVCKVYVSVLDAEGDRKGVMSGLKSAAGYLRRGLGQAVVLRAVPQLVFVYDESLSRGGKILDMLKEIGGADGGDKAD